MKFNIEYDDSPSPLHPFFPSCTHIFSSDLPVLFPYPRIYPGWFTKLPVPDLQIVFVC
jgi:hypothetical protein